jgi:hypothetical protein
MPSATQRRNFANLDRQSGAVLQIGLVADLAGATPKTFSGQPLDLTEPCSTLASRPSTVGRRPTAARRCSPQRHGASGIDGLREKGAAATKLLRLLTTLSMSPSPKMKGSGGITPALSGRARRPLIWHFIVPRSAAARS